MKSIKFLFFFSFIILMVSCKDHLDDDRLFDKTWCLDHVVVKDLSSIFDKENDSYYNRTDADYGDLTYVFKEDGTFRVRALKPSHFNDATYERLTSGTWEDDKGEMVLYMKEGEMVYKVFRVSKKRLVLSYYDGEYHVYEHFKVKE